MSKFKIKKLPPIRLVDLLRKRKTNLKQFLLSSGIVSYTILVQKCEKMGVSAPTEAEFKDISRPFTSSPQEGIIVLDPPTLLVDSGQRIEVDKFNDLLSSSKKQDVIIAKLTKGKEELDLTSSILIDESIFITSTTEKNLEKLGSDLGDELSVDDDINVSVSKLNDLKKIK